MRDLADAQIRNAVASVVRARKQLDRAIQLLASLLPGLPLPGGGDPFERAFSRSNDGYEVGDLGELTIGVPEAAEMLHLHEEYVRRLLREGRLLGISYGGRAGWRLSREYVLEEARRRNPGVPELLGHATRRRPAEARGRVRTGAGATPRAGRA